MKHIIKYTILLMSLLLSMSAFAQKIELRDGSNRLQGIVESDGTVRDSGNRSIGKIERDGTVRDGSNRQIGKVEKDGTLRDSSNRQIGKVSSGDTQAVARAFFFK